MDLLTYLLTYCVCIVAMPSACRTRVNYRQLLESVTCYDVMPRKTCVVVVDSDLPVSSAFLSCNNKAIYIALKDVGSETLLAGKSS